ncbi:MAG: hypothetical protein NVSMB6_02310 [Burkholderiaceae bacterium]
MRRQATLLAQQLIREDKADVLAGLRHIVRHGLAGASIAVQHHGVFLARAQLWEARLA